jgi:hypothetical protein
MPQSRQINKTEKKSLQHQFQDLDFYTQQIIWIYYAYLKSNGALGCDPAEAGISDHWRKYTFIRESLSIHSFRSRAKRNIRVARQYFFSGEHNICFCCDDARDD